MTYAGLEQAPMLRPVNALSRLSHIAIARFPESPDPSLHRRRKTDPGSQP
jgi:hypothetical protein